MALTPNNSVGESQALGLLGHPTRHCGHLQATAQVSVDGEFLKWGLTLGGMVVHILPEGSQITTPKPPVQPLSLPPSQPESRCQPTVSRTFHNKAPTLSSQPVEETEAERIGRAPKGEMNSFQFFLTLRAQLPQPQW